MWQDQFRRENGVIVYESKWLDTEKERLGAIERRENLEWARDHCNGLVRVVIALAKDVSADPRKANDWFPHAKLVMRITRIWESGDFRAESVGE